MKKILYIFLTSIIFIMGCADYKDLKSPYDVFNFLEPLPSAPKGGMAIISPNGGTIKGLPIEVKWVADTTVIKKINIYFIAGEFNTQIANNFDARAGRFLLNSVPSGLQNESFNFRIRLENASNPQTFTESKMTYYQYEVPALQITSPNNEAQVNSGTSLQIIWSYNSNVSLSNYINLYYSFNNGSTWNLIGSYYRTYASTYWTVPEVSTITDCILKIEDASNKSIYNTKSIKILPVPTFVISSPSSSTVWYSGKNYYIQWYSRKSVNANIYYSTNNGGNWIFIGNKYCSANSNNSYNWFVPTAINSVTCKIKIENVSNTSDYAISQTFSILKPQPIKITYPKAGTIWYVGQTYTITWDNNETNTFKVYISSDFGATWYSLSTYVSQKSYSFTVPTSYNSGYYKIRVEDYYGSVPAGVSDSFQIIASTVKLTYPTTGSSIKANSLVNIQWQAKDVNYLKCDFSSDNGVTWQNVFRDQVATAVGSYSWNAPDISSNTCMLRLMDQDNNLIKDEITFSIYKPTLTFVAPTQGATWIGSTQRTIQWTSKNLSYVNIYYSTNGGDTWVGIATNVYSPDKVAPSYNSYSWTVPVFAITYFNCRIKIEDYYDSGTFFISPIFIIQKP